VIEEKKLWELYPHIWSSESAYMSWLRGGLRRYLWSKNPVKLEFIKQNRIKIPNPNPKGKVKEVWGGVCAFTRPNMRVYLPKLLFFSHYTTSSLSNTSVPTM
jgi:hypothetical protein